MMIHGSIVALVTPFRDGVLDEAALHTLIEWQIAEGTHGFVIAGTTGEFPTLTDAEYERLVTLVINKTANRIPVIVGTGTYNTAKSVHLMQFAEKAGATAALVVTPCYNKPNQRGLIQHYKTLHDSSNLPIILYNVPSRSAVDLTIDTIAQLSLLPRIIGIKDATGDVLRASRQRAACKKGFIQLSGDDSSALGFNAQGGGGCISVTGNGAPALCAKLQEACQRGDYETALALQDQLTALNQALFAEPNPVPSKYALSVLGICKEEVRAPLYTLEASTKKQVYAAMEKAGLFEAPAQQARQTTSV